MSLQVCEGYLSLLNKAALQPCIEEAVKLLPDTLPICPCPPGPV